MGNVAWRHISASRFLCVCIYYFEHSQKFTSGLFHRQTRSDQTQSYQTFVVQNIVDKKVEVANKVVVKS